MIILPMQNSHGRLVPAVNPYCLWIVVSEEMLMSDFVLNWQTRSVCAVLVCQPRAKHHEDGCVLCTVRIEGVSTVLLWGHKTQLLQELGFE
jgi:hypothetical protein